MTSKTEVPGWMHVVAIVAIVAAVAVMQMIISLPRYVAGGICGGLGAAWMIYGAPRLAVWRSK